MFHVIVLIVLVACAGMSSVQATEPNPPNWPSSVRVFDPSDNDIESTVNAAFKVNGGHNPANNGQFSKERYAFLFKPGTYAVDVPVGYYTSVYGLGDSPNDVVFSGDKGVYAEEGDYNFQGGALCTFWRSAENFRTTSAHNWQVGTGMIWAVSQASPLRRIVVDNDLSLFEYQPPAYAAGYSSGGFIANSEIKGDLKFGSQQQFMVRNVNLGQKIDTPPVWNGVFVGCAGEIPESHCGSKGTSQHPIVTAAKTPSIAEKPFISFESEKYFLNVPKLRIDSTGNSFDDEVNPIDFSKVYVTNVNDDAATINSKLAQGLHIVISPGIYYLDTSLQVTYSNQVLLGLGMATLVTTSHEPCITVGDRLDGVRNTHTHTLPLSLKTYTPKLQVRIAGLLLEAKVSQTSSLLLWGSSTYKGDSTNPGILSDVFARNGVFTDETVSSSVDTMVSIYSGNVIIDNTWLWRADHDSKGVVDQSENPTKHGLYVHGDDVIAYGQ